jgi:intracellular sulfur oxidation DsrE/DsrF family protein
MILLLALVPAVTFAASSPNQADAKRRAEPLNTPGFWSTPTIPGYGRIHYLPDSAFQPAPNKTYKLLFWLHHGPKDPGKVNSGLDHVARAINLYRKVGVPWSHLKIIVIASGGATPFAIDNKHYQAKFGVANPNIKLLKLLDQHHVVLSVCSQAVAEHGFQENWVLPDVKLALSGLTTVLDFQLKGYALMPL